MSTDAAETSEDEEAKEQPNRLVRLMRDALIAFFLIVGLIVGVAYCAGEKEDLPFEYEGFD